MTLNGQKVLIEKTDPLAINHLAGGLAIPPEILIFRYKVWGIPTEKLISIIGHDPQAWARNILGREVQVDR